ncbi:MAG: hypothetical protein OES46_20460 [Gammaproteobacteria bacterium]|nr:hypothetical protein [Gammaproteobacteria bacterium]
MGPPAATALNPCEGDGDAAAEDDYASAVKALRKQLAEAAPPLKGTRKRLLERLRAEVQSRGSSE